MEFTLRWEVGNKPNGGYTDDPDDPGGRTKWGISAFSHPGLDIANLTPEQATKIYSDEYWDKSGSDEIPFPFCTAVFDTAVNLGNSRALNWSKPLIVTDPVPGPYDYNMTKVRYWIKQAKSVREFLDMRKKFYYDRINIDPRSAKYLKGWLNRCSDLQKFVDQNTDPIGSDLTKSPLGYSSFSQR